MKKLLLLSLLSTLLVSYSATWAAEESEPEEEISEIMEEETEMMPSNEDEEFTGEEDIEATTELETEAGE